MRDLALWHVGITAALATMLTLLIVVQGVWGAAQRALTQRRGRRTPVTTSPATTSQATPQREHVTV